MNTYSSKEVRMSGIGGSDIAAIAGLSKWSTPLKVYLEKIGELDFPEENKFMRWGKKMEPLLIEEYTEKTGKKVESHPIKYDSSYPFLFAHIDGLIEDGGILECKTASFSKEWGAEGSDDIPKAYLLQCAHYARVFDASYVDIAVLIGGNTFRVYRYNRNLHLENNILEIATNFWKNHVLKRIPPDPKNKEDIHHILKKSLSEHMGEKLITDDMLQILEEIQSGNKTISHLKITNEELKEQLVTFLESDHYFVDKSGKRLCSYKTIIKPVFDNKSFKEKHPDLYKQFLIERKEHRFHIYKEKEGVGEDE